MMPLKTSHCITIAALYAEWLISSAPCTAETTSATTETFNMTAEKTNETTHETSSSSSPATETRKTPPLTTLTPTIPQTPIPITRPFNATPTSQTTPQTTTTTEPPTATKEAQTTEPSETTQLTSTTSQTSTPSVIPPQTVMTSISSTSASTSSHLITSPQSPTSPASSTAAKETTTAPQPASSTGAFQKTVSKQISSMTGIITELGSTASSQLSTESAALTVNYTTVTGASTLSSHSAPASTYPNYKPLNESKQNQGLYKVPDKTNCCPLMLPCNGHRACYLPSHLDKHYITENVNGIFLSTTCKLLRCVYLNDFCCTFRHYRKCCLFSREGELLENGSSCVFGYFKTNETCVYICTNMTCEEGQVCEVVRDSVTGKATARCSSQTNSAGAESRDSGLSREKERAITLGVLIPVTCLCLFALFCACSKLSKHGRAARDFQNKYNVNTGNL